jgi:hypothetical protein
MVLLRRYADGRDRLDGAHPDRLTTGGGCMTACAWRWPGGSCLAERWSCHEKSKSAAEENAKASWVQDGFTPAVQRRA